MNRDSRRPLMRRIRELSFPQEPLPTGLEPRVRALPGLRAVLFDVYGTLFVSAAGQAGHEPDPAGGPQAAAGAAGSPSGVAAQSRAAGQTAGQSEAVDPAAAAAAAALEAAGFAPAAGSGEAGSRALREEIGRRHAEARARGQPHPEVEIRSVWRRVLQRLSREGRIPPPGRLSTPRLERLALEYELRVNPVWPMPDLRRILLSLRRDLCLGLVSNAQFYTPLLFPALLGSSLEELGFREELCLWSFRQGLAKPSPGLVGEALGRLRAGAGIAPEETLFVGNDWTADILPAAAAGCRTALFAGDRRSLRLPASDAARPGGAAPPDLILTDLSQLLTALGS